MVAPAHKLDLPPLKKKSIFELLKRTPEPHLIIEEPVEHADVRLIEQLKEELWNFYGFLNAHFTESQPILMGYLGESLDHCKEIEEALHYRYSAKANAQVRTRISLPALAFLKIFLQ